MEAQVDMAAAEAAAVVMEVAVDQVDQVVEDMEDRAHLLALMVVAADLQAVELHKDGAMLINNGATHHSMTKTSKL